MEQQDRLADLVLIVGLGLALVAAAYNWRGVWGGLVDIVRERLEVEEDDAESARVGNGLRAVEDEVSR